MKIINMSKEELNSLKNNLFEESGESNTYLIYNDDKPYIIKIFKKNCNIDNKIKKIKLMNERLTNHNNVVIADSLIKYNKDFIGYSMPYVKGETFSGAPRFNKKDTILILKNISSILKSLHKKSIVCGDFQGNILIDKDKNINFIDHDNFAIDDLPIDLKNIFVKEYQKSIKKIDKNFDNYLLNLFTLSVLNHMYIAYIYREFKLDPDRFYFKNDEINSIIDNTMNLKNFYNEDLIIDKINSKKDIKKLKHIII